MPDISKLLDDVAKAAIESSPQVAKNDGWFALHTGDFHEERTALVDAGVSQGEANRLTACMALARHQITAEQREAAGKPVTRATTNAISYLEKFV